MMAVVLVRYENRHEQENGRTSAVTIEIMGYDANDQQVMPVARGHHARWQEIMEKSSHSVNFINVWTREISQNNFIWFDRYDPDYCVLVVGANSVQVMTREHISISLALNIPML